MNLRAFKIIQAEGKDLVVSIECHVLSLGQTICFHISLQKLTILCTSTGLFIGSWLSRTVWKNNQLCTGLFAMRQLELLCGYCAFNNGAPWCCCLEWLLCLYQVQIAFMKPRFQRTNNNEVQDFVIRGHMLHRSVHK